MRYPSINKNDIHYIVNEETRKVICIIENTQLRFTDYVMDNFGFKPWADMYSYNGKIFDRFVMPKKFIGIATCSVDDEFSSETGKLIAYSRAKEKMDKSFFKRAQLYMWMVDRQTDEIAEHINKYGHMLENSTQKRHNKINKILNRKDNL